VRPYEGMIGIRNFSQSQEKVKKDQNPAEVDVSGGKESIDKYDMK